MSSGFPLKAKGKLYAGLWVFPWPHERGIVLLQQKTSNNPQKKVWIMKRIILATVAALVVIVSASAQRLADVRAEATIITDKMIAELGIGPGYRNSILNINLAYLNSINSYRDIDSYGWERRNREIRRYLSPGQWRKYCNTYYFYRPIGWQNRAYVHHIYRRYPGLPPSPPLRPRPRPPSPPLRQASWPSGQARPRLWPPGQASQARPRLWTSGKARQARPRLWTTRQASQARQARSRLTVPAPYRPPIYIPLSVNDHPPERYRTFPRSLPYRFSLAPRARRGEA